MSINSKSSDIIKEYIAEFKHLNNRLKAYDMDFSETILAYKFLNNSSISGSNKKLIQATLAESMWRFEFVS